KPAFARATIQSITAPTLDTPGPFPSANWAALSNARAVGSHARASRSLRLEHTPGTIAERVVGSFTRCPRSYDPVSNDRSAAHSAAGGPTEDRKYTSRRRLQLPARRRWQVCRSDPE